MNSRKIHRVAVRLVFWLVVVSSVLALTGTVVELYIDYRRHIDRMTERVDEIAKEQLPEIKRIIKTGNSEDIDRLLKEKLSGIDSTAHAVIIVENEISWHKREPQTGEELISRHSFGGNRQKELGTGALRIVTDITPLREYIVTRFFQSLIANGIKISLVAVFVFLMFQYLVTRHLESIARQLQLHDITRPSEPITLQRKKRNRLDELDQVVADLNVMRERAHNALQQLERNEERLLLFFDSTAEAIVGVDRAGNCTFANDACMEMLGRGDFDEVLGKPLDQLFLLKTLNAIQLMENNALIMASMELGCHQHSEEGYLAIVKGPVLPVSLHSYPVFQSGQVSGAVVFIKDNSEKSHLMHQRELLSMAVEQSPVMVVIANDQNRIEYVNHGTERWSGLTKSELIGRSLLSFANLSLEDDLNLKQLAQKLESGEKWEGVVRTESVWGSSVTLFCVVSPVFDHNNQLVNTIAVCREASYEMALQDEFLNVKKMEAVGRLSASFAHEFGNPLFGVRAVIKDILEKPELEGESRHLLELASEECEKMRNMVREFQDVYIETKSSDSLVSLQGVLDTIMAEIEDSMGEKNVRCFVDLDEKAAVYMVSRNKCSLVLRNIIQNSLEAMANSGGELRVVGRLSGEWISVEIVDSGEGIDKELQEFVFEPFFTTKPDVEGAGLGLSVAYGTAKRMGGTITFSSAEDKGSCFTVYLPTT